MLLGVWGRLCDAMQRGKGTLGAFSKSAQCMVSAANLMPHLSHA
jgi:hypothetical protein